MFSIMAPNRRRGWQNFEKKTGEALAETVFSRNFVTLGADFEGHNWKHDLARLCFMLYTPTPSYGISQLKMEILEFTSKEAAAPLMSLAAPLWFWKFREKIQNFGIFFTIFENYGEFWKNWIIISNVGGKFWRWEGIMKVYTPLTVIICLLLWKL